MRYINVGDLIEMNDDADDIYGVTTSGTRWVVYHIYGNNVACLVGPANLATYKKFQEGKIKRDYHTHYKIYNVHIDFLIFIEPYFNSLDTNQQALKLLKKDER